MRFTVVIFLVLGLTCAVVTGRAGKRRVLRVRKTGEFGRRIPAISQFYEPPKRGLDQFLHTSESRTLDNVIGIRKPSQSLELPIYSIPEQMYDSETAETGENPRGYAYPNPSPSGGYDFSPMKVRPPANPIAEYPETDQGEQQEIDPPPHPVQPEKEAAFFGSPKPFGAETDSQIDAAEQTPRPAAPPTPVHDSPAADTQAHCDENDPNCWPHGYEGVIPGVAGQDYPVLSEIMDTAFDCENVQYSGYYADADAEARCQIFHICLKGNAYRKTQKWSFLCPNGTVFSQGDFVCVWWNNAPECNSGVVGELSLRNAELGWDNLTEEETRSAVGGGFNGKMSSFTSNSNIQASGSNSRSKSTRPTGTTKRPPTQQQQQSSRNAIRYRVPVKENARTKLKEVAGNGIREPEYTGQESETFETSLRHQSEARHRSKTASALRKSESEAYEQKSVPESVAPFVINRGSNIDDDNDAQQLQTVERGEYSEEEQVPKLVIMPTQQKNPDGSGAYAEVPVMMGSSGYRYPNPNPISTPGPEYLPPRKEKESYSSPSTTEATLTTTTFLPSATEESLAADDGGYQYQTTQTSSFSAQLKETTTTEQGYNYPSPTTTEQGYNYPAPTTTDAERGEYNYPSQTSTTTDVNYQDDGVSSQPLSIDGGYEYETSTASVDTSTNNNNNNVAFPSTTNNPEGGYLPPNNDESTTSTGYPRSSAALQIAPDVLSLGQTSGDDSTGEADLDVNKVDQSSTVGPQTEDFTEIAELSTTGGNSGSESGGYEDKSNIQEFTIPTPSSTSAANLGTLTQLYLPALREQFYAKKQKNQLTSPNTLSADNQENVNRILQEIQNGGAEVRDENGNKLDYAELQKLIESTPNGLLSLQKADESVTTDVPNPNFPSTEVPSVIPQELEQEVTTVPQEPQSQVSKLETVQTIEETPSQRYLPQPQPQYQQKQNNNNNYFSNNQLGSITRPGYEISTPSKEYESHILQQNSIESSPNPFSTFSSFQTERQPQTQTQPNVASNNYYTPQSQTQQQTFQHNFASVQNVQNTQSPQVYFQQPLPSQAPQVQHQSQYQHQFLPRLQEQPQAIPTPEVNFVQTNQQANQQYFHQQNQIPQQYNSHSESAFSQNPRIISPSVANSHSQLYYQTQSQAKNQDQFVQQQQRQSATEYLPPPSSTSNSQLFSTNSSPIQFRSNNLIVPSTPTRNLNNDIELQRSYSVQMPQASNNRQQQVSKPLDIKIVPALLVNTHTRVEHQNENTKNKIANLNGSNQQQRQFSNNQNTYLPYPIQAENNVLETGRSPRLNPFRLEDALPKVEKFTPKESRHSMQFNSGRNYLNMPSNKQINNNDFYPGRDNSLGVRLTYD